MANELAVAGAAVARIDAIGLGRILAAKLPATVAVGLQWRRVPVVGADGQLERLEVHDLTVSPGASRDELMQALDVARQACRAAGPADAYAAVVPLVRLAARRVEGDLDAALRREVWARELAEFPTDAIAEAARRFLRRGPFLPHISELIAEVERIMAPRRQLVLALEKAAAESSTATPSPAALPQPSRADRLRAVIAAWTARSQRHRAAGAELELAKIEGRPAAAWATRPKQPAAPPTAVGAPSPMETRLAELAAQRRRRLEGEE